MVNKHEKIEEDIDKRDKNEGNIWKNVKVKGETVYKCKKAQSLP